MKLLVLLLGFGVMTLAPAFASSTDAETVVLLHGLGRTRFSMARLACELERDGYRVINLSYPSRTQSLEENATKWLHAQLAQVQTPRLHFVTHSMGGILVRLWLSEHGAPANLGRVVMLAPPNAGSEVSDRLTSFPAARWLVGPNMGRLTTAPDALPATLGPWPATAGELGVIAGDRPMNRLMAAFLPAPSDGKVTVASTHLAGERDHVVLPYSHTWLGWRAETIGHVKAFLRDGKFGGRRGPLGPPVS
ncbi:MAG TPA: alpha/beta fold hydrolase [Opitutaceae bacterium]|nr:alpha/beta fold hydrolase [Opitutaceae bacterium]